jgi:hypothetical protein
MSLTRDRLIAQKDKSILSNQNSALPYHNSGVFTQVFLDDTRILSATGRDRLYNE